MTRRAQGVPRSDRDSVWRGSQVCDLCGRHRVDIRSALHRDETGVFVAVIRCRDASSCIEAQRAQRGVPAP